MTPSQSKIRAQDAESADPKVFAGLVAMRFREVGARQDGGITKLEIGEKKHSVDTSFSIMAPQSRSILACITRWKQPLRVSFICMIHGTAEIRKFVNKNA